MQNIFKKIFDFHGTINNKGTINEIEGKLFDDNNVDNQSLIGQRFLDIFFLNKDSFPESMFNNILLNAGKGEISKVTLNFLPDTIKNKIVELNFVPIKENESDSDKIFFCANDITGKENEIEFYKQRSEHFLYAAESADIGLWFWDLVKNEIFSTPKCNELFELQPFDIFELEHFYSVIHPDDLTRVESELKASHDNGQEYNCEYRVVRSDGNICWIAARGNTFLDENNKPINMMGSVRDINDQKMAAEELAVIYELERKARDEAVKVNKAKDFFFAVVSHELRSPLNAILGWSKILLSKDVDEKTRINALETIERSAKSQSKLIDDLVDSARITSGKLKLEMRRVNLFEIIKNVYNSKRPEAEDKHINFQMNCDEHDLEVFGDTVRLQQVFTNILSNAIKFTDENGNISIDVLKSTESVKVKISDDGQGINEQDIAGIFDQFSQGSDKSQGTTNLGLGLGLSIAKILTQKHDGKIAAESQGRHTGSTFTVTLPLLVNDTNTFDKELKTADSEEVVLDGLQILVVEDDYDSRNVLKLLLESLGAKVDSSESAKKALEKLNNMIQSPDVIISDIAMPDEDGNSFIRKIRSNENDKIKNIPAIALSAFTADENKEKSLASGFQIYHTKPFDPDLLIEEIKSLVNQ
jgi:PAS domain S-box-containing protein